MKLHLPTGLRAALFACFAAFAGIGTTLTTATITGGVFAVTMAGQAVAADIPEPEADGDIWLPAGEYTLTSAMDGASYLINSAEKVQYRVDGQDVVSIQTGEFPGWGQSTEFKKLGEGTLVVTGLPVINAGSAEETTAESVAVAEVAEGTLKIAYDGTIPKIVVGGGTAVISSTLSATDVSVSTGTLKVEGALTLSGTLTLDSAIQMGDAASFAMAAGSTIDISNLQADADGDGKTFTILTGAGANLDLSTLTDVKIVGLSGQSGVTWTFGTDGKISYTVLSGMTFAGGDLEWNTTDADFTLDGAAVAFTNGGYAVFAADTNAVLQEDISASALKVEQGATLSIDRAEHALSVGTMELEGTLRVTEAGAFDAGKIDVAAWTGSGSIQLDADATFHTNAHALPDAYTGKVIVSQGQLILNTDVSYESVTVTSGGDARFEKSYAGNIFMAGTGNGWGAGAIQLADGVTLSGEVTLTGESSVSLWNEAVGAISNKLNLDHQLTVNKGGAGNGTLKLLGDIVGGGGIVIESGAVYIGDSNYATSALETGDVTINGGAKLHLFHGGGGSFLGKEGVAANLTMKDGAILENYDINGESPGHQWGTLTVEGTANFSYGTGMGIQKFANLTAGDGTYAVALHSNNGDNKQQTHFAQITDFNGTITSYLWNGETEAYEARANASNLYIGTVSQKAEASLSIVGGAHTTAFAKIGEGSLSVDTLVVDASGKLTVNYQGTLNIGALTLSDNVTLAYTSSTDPLISLGADLFADKTAMTLDVSALSSADLMAGFDTGIASSVDQSLFTTELGSLTGDVSWEKDETTGTWKLTMEAPAWSWNTPGEGTWSNDSADGWSTAEGTTPNGQKVVFGDAGVAGGTTTIKIAGEVTPKSVEVNATSGTYVFTGDGSDATANDGIAGTAALTKNGGSKLTLETANSSTGTLTINEGTVEIGSTSVAGDWAGDIVANGTSMLFINGVSDQNLGKITAADGVYVIINQGVTLAGLTGGNLSAYTAGSDVTINSAANLVSVDNSGPNALVFGGDVVTQTLSNRGTIKTNNNDLTVTGAVYGGGKLDAGTGTVTLGSGATFTDLHDDAAYALVAGTLSANGYTVTMDGKGSIGAIDSTGEQKASLVISYSRTDIGSDATLAALDVYSGTHLTVAGGLTVEGGITSGVVDPVDDFDLNLTGVSDVNQLGVQATGDITAGSVGSLAGNLISTSGSISINGDAKIDTVSDGATEPTYKGGNLAAGKNITISGAATIGGNVTATAGTVTLAKGGSIGGNMAAKDAAFGGYVSVGGDMVLLGGLSISDLVTVNGAISGMTSLNVAEGILSTVPAGSTANIVLAKTFAVGESFTLAFDSLKALTDLGLSDGDSQTIISAAVSGDLTGKLALNVAGTEQKDVVTVAYGTLMYTLSATQDGILLTAAYDGNDWDQADAVWVDGSGQGTYNPSEDDKALFTGSGSSSVNVSGPVTAQAVVVDTSNAGATGTTTYQFSGADGAVIETQALQVIAGELGMENVSMGTAARPLASTEVGEQGTAPTQPTTLNVGEGAKLYTQSLAVVDGAGFSNAGRTEVTNALSASGTTISNTGDLAVGAGTTIAGVEGSGRLTVTGSAGIGTVDGASEVRVKPGQAGDFLWIERMQNVDFLNVGAGAATEIGTVDGPLRLMLAGDSSAVIGNTGAVTITELVSGGKLEARNAAVTLTTATAWGGNVVAGALDVSTASGSTFSGVMTNALTMDISTMNTASALLNVDSITTIPGKSTNEPTIALTLTGIDKSNVGGFGYNDYLLISSATEILVGDFTALDATLQQLFALENKAYASLNVVQDNGSWNLVLSVKEDTPREWDSSKPGWAGNNANNNGEVLDVDKIAGIYKDFDTVDVVNIDKDTVIDLTQDTLANATDASKGLELKEVNGAGGLTVQGDGATADLVTFSNATATQLAGVLALDNVAANVIGSSADAKLTVGGLKLTDAIVTVEGSSLETSGAATMADSMVAVQSGSALTTGVTSLENTWLTAADGASLTTGAATMTYSTVTAGDDTTVAINGTATLDTSSVEVGDNSALTVDGDVTLHNSALVAGDNSTITAGKVALSGADAELTVGTGSKATVTSLTGKEGVLSGAITVTGKGGDYSGSYNNANITLGANAAHSFAVGKGLSLSSAAASKAAATLNYTGANTAMGKVNVAATDVALNNINASTGKVNTLNVAAGSQMTGGTLSFSVNAADIAAGVGQVIANGLSLDGTSIVATQADPNASITFDLSQSTEGMTLFTISQGTGVTVNVADVTLSGSFFDRYFDDATVTVEGGKVKADLITDRHARELAQTENGRMGMEMVDIAELQLAPKTGDIADVIKALDAYQVAKDGASADRLASAVAGSGVASLGMALSGDVERQLKAIRNRTTNMGVDPSVVNEDMPYFNAWINAEGDHRTMDEDGSMAGYTLDSWGGTVGFDMDVTPSFTWGLAVTAMYGDFSAESADTVEGDVDTYYVSAFARAMSGAWVHTFVATLGMSSSDISRTVSTGEGAYSTQGDTDGMSFGLLYEVARTFALNEDATACWQPVFNVAYRHIEVDGYNESGSDAALSVGDQSLDTVTFGLGGRVQAIVGESIYNRTSIFEARALVKLDAGDRESEMDTALLSASAARGTVKSAELGAFGVELGAGITVPLGMDSGSIFADGAVEFRSSYISANGTLGYRINF